MAVQTYINALQPVNVGGALAAGQEQGRKDAQQLAVRNALANYQANPQAAQNALVAAGDIQGASSLSKFAETQRAATVRDQIAPMVKSGDYTGAAKTAAAGGDFDTAGALGKLNDAQLEKVQKLAEAKASASYTLRQLPADQRQAALQQMIPQLTQLGIPADQIGQTPLTDDYLDRSISEGMSLKEKVAQTTSQRDFEAKRTDAANLQADRLADNDRQTKAEAARERAANAREGRLLAAVGGASAGQWVRTTAPDGTDILRNTRTGDEKSAPGARTGQLKTAPPAIQKGYQENLASIKQIDDAIAELERNPNAMGLKNYAPEGMTQRLDPNGVGTRGKVANIGSQIIHDRSGAAVTAAETPRLKPFIPAVTDDPKAAITKLRGLRQQVVNETSGIEVAYGEDTGYRPLGGRAAAPKAAPKPANRPPLSAIFK